MITLQLTDSQYNLLLATLDVTAANIRKDLAGFDQQNNPRAVERSKIMLDHINEMIHLVEKANIPE
jgi:hypothetical protein